MHAVVLFLVAAFTAGLTSSIHCAVMCGPLAAIASRPLGWHLGRIATYAFIGLALGSLGSTVAHVFRDLEPVLPWVMVAGLLMTAFDVGRRVSQFRFLSTLFSKAATAVDPSMRSVLLGAATAFLPCGLLYGMFITAIGAGTPLSGAGVMFAFALGSTPLLFAAQRGRLWLGRFRRATSIARVAVPMLAAALIVFRTLSVQPDAVICH